MKNIYFVQYFNSDFSYPCGDRAVLILDGRNSLETHVKDAIENNGKRRPKYYGFEIRFGTFVNSRILHGQKIQV